MIRALPILCLLLCSCQGARVDRVDAVARVETWGPHHGRATVGPRVRYANEVEVYVWAGRQEALFWPGEPPVSERAPVEGWPFGVEVSAPLYRRGR